jgi:hypothetical protein
MEVSGSLIGVWVRRAFVAALLALLISALHACSEDEEGIVEVPKTLGQPTLVGPNSARPGAALTLCVVPSGGGAGLEYQFDFDPDSDGGLLAWSPDSCQSNAWAFEGRQAVRARVREGTIVSEWSDTWDVVIIDETVEPPSPPTGDNLVIVGGTVRLCGAGASSSMNHPVEYRFKIDPNHIMDWHIDRCSSFRWYLPGTFKARAQARCVLHTGIVSQWSTSFELISVSGADTRILRVISTPELGSGTETEVDFQDATPDTLPMGSWVTLVVEGSSPDYAFGTCDDPINRCIGFQMQYERVRETVPTSRLISPWLPSDPFDGNPSGVTDTIRMNVGSVDYVIRARANDEFGAEGDPSSLPIIGNFDPTLEDSFIENHDGAIVRHGDTLRWDWWAPENTDTLDVSSGERKKRFTFLIRANGHDDPRDPVGSSIKAWRYFFVAADNPVLLYNFARAGAWVATLEADALSDTVTWEVRYPSNDINGDTVFSDLPIWINRGWDYAIRGRDTSASDQFEQYVYIDGDTQLLNAYNVSDFGRRTESGFQRFFIELKR